MVRAVALVSLTWGDIAMWSCVGGIWALGLPAARTRTRQRRARGLRERCLSPAADNLSRAQSASSLSLASAATTEPESIHSGGAPSQR